VNSRLDKEALQPESFLLELIQAVDRFNHANITEDVRQRAKDVILDTVGVILHGNRTDYLRRLAISLSSGVECKGSTVFGWGYELPPHEAAWINASGGTVHELDEGHRYAKGHPGIGIVPTVLALAQKMNLSGAATLNQIIFGYEFSARISQAIGKLKLDFHPHGTWGTLGAAFAAARTIGLSGEQLENAVFSAASLSMVSGRAAVTSGASIRNMYAGFAVLNGMLCAEAASAGIAAPVEAFASFRNIISLKPFKSYELVSFVGKPFEITRNYFKRHAACAHVHAALDAFVRAMEDSNLIGNKIRSVKVETYPEAAALCDWKNLTPVSAKFSIPYAISARIVSGETGPCAFENDMIERVRRSGWLDRIFVVEMENSADLLQDLRPARVTLTLNDGSKASAMVQIPRGHFDNPFDNGFLEDKFRYLTKGLLARDQQDEIVFSTRRLDSLDHIRDYFASLNYIDAKGKH
jgi:2-methylcitrate dehydratase PrpD